MYTLALNLILFHFLIKVLKFQAIILQSIYFTLCHQHLLFNSFLTKSQQFILRYSLTELASYYQTKNPAQSKEILELGKHFFYNENEDSKIEYTQDYKAFYDRL